MSESQLIEVLKRKAVRLDGPGVVADEILDLCGDARFVLIGEASNRANRLSPQPDDQEL